LTDRSVTALECYRRPGRLTRNIANGFRIFNEREEITGDITPGPIPRDAD